MDWTRRLEDSDEENLKKTLHGSERRSRRRGIWLRSAPIQARVGLVVRSLLESSDREELAGPVCLERMRFSDMGLPAQEDHLEGEA